MIANGTSLSKIEPLRPYSETYDTMKGNDCPFRWSRDQRKSHRSRQARHEA